MMIAEGSRFQTLLVAQTDGVLTVSVNRPDAYNALSDVVLNELRELLTELAATEGFDVRGMILTGAGERAFIAGADIRTMSQMSPDEGEAFGALGQEVTELLEALPIPVVACVNGYALGGGCEMAMACDFIYATDSAKFGQPEVSLGLIPGFGGCVRLQRLVGPGRAKELIFTGRHIAADEARRIGLVNEVFSSRDDMLVAADGSLREAATRSPSAIALSKATINASQGRTTTDALAIERRAFRDSFMTADMREGTQAFLEKRPPSFTGASSAAR